MTWFENGGQETPKNWFTELGSWGQNTMANPMFLGGIGLATGGMDGLGKGVQAGNSFAEAGLRDTQRKKTQQMLAGADSDPRFAGLEPGLIEAARATGDISPLVKAWQGMPSERRAAEMHPLDMAYRRAQTIKAQHEARDGGGLGKQFTPFFDPNTGITYAVQAGPRGLQLTPILAPQAPGAQQPAANAPAPQMTPEEMAGSGPSRFAQPSIAPPQQPQPQQRQPLRPMGMSVHGDTIYDRFANPVGNVGEALTRGEIAKGRGDHLVKLEASLPKSRASLEAANAKVDLVRNKIAQALPMVSNWTAGYGAKLDKWPASAARDFKGVIDTIVANLGFDELQEMRANSPTGGALGQVAVQELDMLQKTKASLDRAQSPEQVMRALQELDQFYADAVPRRQRAFDNTYAPLRGQRAAPGATMPAGQRQGSGASGSIPRISGDADYQSLPAGSQYYGPDGKLRRKN